MRQNYEPFMIMSNIPQRKMSQNNIRSEDPNISPQQQAGIHTKKFYSAASVHLIRNVPLNHGVR